MFKRWIILLFASVALSALSGFWFAYQAGVADDSFTKHHDECYDYLYEKDDGWTADGDYYYKFECDSSNPGSIWTIKQEVRSEMYGSVDMSIMVAISLAGLIFFSFLVRWLITGKTSWD